MSLGETGKKPAKIDSAELQRARNTAMRLFVSAVLDMSWQLALVVLIPVIGGFELDKHLHSTPWLTLLGFVIAMGGSYVIMKRMLAEYGNKSVSQSLEKK